ncbi:hypothetical protein KA005_76575 [bacterium]|nr:hypothetical protein [bacterium]
MNIEQKQKDEELLYLEQFFKTMKIKPEHIKRGEDPPDFYMVYQSNKIAIEVTEYHSMRKGPGDHAWRAVEEEWQRIRELFIKERKRYPKLDDVHGFLSFRELKMPPANKHGQFVTELLEFGISQYKTLTEEISSFDSFPSNYPLLNKYLKKIHLQNVNCYMTWDRDSATFVGITEKELEKCVSKKLKNPRPQQISENWLLIVSGSAMSQQIGLTPCKIFNDFVSLNSRLEKSSFDKIFFFQYVCGRVLCWSQNKQWKEVKPARTARGIVRGLQ